MALLSGVGEGSAGVDFSVSMFSPKDLNFPQDSMNEGGGRGNGIILVFPVSGAYFAIQPLWSLLFYQILLD